MKVPVGWLRDYVDIKTSFGDLAHRLTLAGLETSVLAAGDWDPQLVTVGQVVAVEPHPRADRLKLATVELGGGRMTVVCGAPNVAVGQKVAFGQAGARLIDGHTGQPTVLRPATIRGVESAGMVLSERELGLSDEHEGILVLPADAPVGAPLRDVLGGGVLEVEVTPNRPDWLSVVGVAREVAALGGTTVREPDLAYREEGAPAAELARVEVADPDLCFRYVATVVEGLTIAPSPPWMQQRLAQAGMRPINNVVDVTNYVMLELGQPLHAFDLARLGERRVVVRRARPGERLVTLGGVERPLGPEMLVIADAERAVGLAGVIGGGESEVTDATTTVLLESATFHPGNIRRTSQGLRLRTEASLRFEKGLNPELAVVAARRATKLLVEVCGGRAAVGVIDVFPGRRPAPTITVTPRRLRQVLGVEPDPTEVTRVLESLGFAVESAADGYRVRVPCWRTDIQIPDDLAEEYARIVGYDALPLRPLTGQVPPFQPEPLRDLRERVRGLLASAGMQEVITYSLTSLEALRRLLPPEELEARPPLRVANPMSQEMEYLRPTLRAGVLSVLAANLRQVETGLALFEVGRAFLPRPQDLPAEVETAVGVVAGPRPDRWGRASGEALDFYDAKGYLEHLLGSLELAATFEEGEDPILLAGRTARLQAGGVVLGVLGQVAPQVASRFDIDGLVYLFEVEIEAVGRAAAPPTRYRPVTRFPAVTRDLALVVDSPLPARRLQEAIEGHPLVRRARVFDVYTGEKVPPGKKSLAFSVTYQAEDHTLTDDEVTGAQQGIVARLRSQFGAQLRS